MRKEVLEKEVVDAAISSNEAMDRAYLFEGRTQAPFRFQKIVIDLSTDRDENDPLEINIPFKSVYIEKSDQPSSVIFLKPNTRDSYQSSIELRRGVSLGFDKPISKCFLWWNAPITEGLANQKLTLIFCVDGKIDSGNALIQIASPGYFYTQVFTLAAATATLLNSSWFDFAPSGGNPRKITFYNGTGATLYIGASDVDDTDGFPIPDGGYFEHTNLQAMYGYSVAGGEVRVIGQS